MVDTFARQRQLVGTTAEWAANDLVVGYGEFAIELVSPGRMRAKLGDGVSVFSALAYFDPSVTAYVNKAGDTMSGPLVVPELDAADAAFTGPVDLGAGAVVLEPADNDNTQRVPSTHWVQARVGGIITGLKLLGTWNAATNSPTLVNGVGSRGDFYMCSVAGSTPLDGITSWAAGDSVVFNGVAWQKVPQTLNQAQIVAGLGYIPAPVTPPGVIVDYAGAAAPAGWMLCQGQAVSRTGATAALFAAIGTVYGIGDGTTTFNLPDLGGRVTAGKEAIASRLTTAGAGVDGATLGASGGIQTYALTIANLAAHSHTFGNGGSEATYNTGLNLAYTINVGGSQVNLYNGGNETANTGTGTAHQNTQPTIVMNKIIKT